MSSLFHYAADTIAKFIAVATRPSGAETPELMPSHRREFLVRNNQLETAAINPEAGCCAKIH